KLYDKDIERKSNRLCFFHKMFPKTENEIKDVHHNRRKCTPIILNEILKELIGDYMEPLYITKTTTQMSSIVAHFRKIEKTRTHNDIKLEYVYRDLFL
ncbi:unnamed protein product, partial [Didymodactylos carnosus]